jgi:hypothetical protein
MTLRLVAVLLLCVGAAGLLLIPATKSGLGSCGPYGPLGFMTILGPLLVITGAIILTTQLAIRLVKPHKNATKP